ncbi:ABC transporter permease subunit [Pseudomonas kermanshahensis]|jgi:glycine betaine/proline transport system permease protein|uniref:ABC transporter permease subunit n=1 Tax=Pseudomonas kermanshahensis TaxID=2745482 RepID=A0ABU8R7M1_9PSED|nr:MULTISPECIES: ABC transporter permease subunit [Pseudomonas]MBC3486614.1 ABC transporter permease subunit [Pseudomonas sp. SWRI50]MBC3497616.1 ABC transporter permease subunit [Pseudomonas sp. SWRI67]MBV4526476.1 ABC transporter permease subunit [Pseudomonas kermanshahensis]MCX2686332.1 ABC transporter permease subunit [Pseudomonas sp. DCB_AW]SMF63458.1 glycine betaine/proline transport system permease protein [Pseudomonas sp. LAIL14HWK12:I11]
MSGGFPEALQFSFAGRVNQLVDWLVLNYGDHLRSLSDQLLQLLVGLENLLRLLPWWALLLVVGLLAWHASRSLLRSLMMVALLALIGVLGLWDKLLQTLALVLISTGLCVMVGVPLGILLASRPLARRLLMPVLDVMQTLPAFVYLIPVLMLFGLGKVPAVFATLIYALPPLVRLTELGLRQIDPSLLQAAHGLGASRWQRLRRIALPLALPSIMAGLNQSVMMALSMVVVASMIGARGLGEDVLAGIQTLNVGQGVEAGLAIVALAMVIDRISQAYGRTGR